MVRAALAAIVLTALASPVSAQEQKSSPLPSHLPLGVEACFGRTYDAAHLRAHPKQRVTRFHLFRDFSVDGNAEEPPLSSGQFKDSDGEYGRVNLNAFVSFRDKPGVYSNWLSCGRSDDGVIRCGIDCDGGGFKLRVSGKGLLVDNEGFVVVGGCGASDDERENSEYVKPGADDRTFRLDPQPLAACVAQREQFNPAWARLGSPIRVRLDSMDAVCFSRSYDAAYLAKHPKQNVRRIAVLKPAGTKAVYEEQRVYDLTMRIEMRDGRKVEKKARCSPDRYSYVCANNPEMDASQDFYLTRAGDAQIMLRDRRGKLADLFKARLGVDDRMFKLSSGDPKGCDF